MEFSFQYRTAPGDAMLEVVDALADADFAIVDADAAPAVKGVTLSGKVGSAVFVGATAPPGAAKHLPRPIDPGRILQALEELIALHRHAHPNVPADPITLRELPVLEDVVAAPVPRLLRSTLVDIPLPALPIAPPVGAAGETVRAAARARNRAAVRRAQRATLVTGTDPLRDVLVLDADAEAAGALRGLLECFGFSGEVVASIAHAGEQLRTRAFAAIFLDIALDGSDRGAGLELLQSIRRMPPPAGHPPPATVLVAAHLRPADRVRASLAGVGMPLIKPASRGDVARALEACGVPFPADARRR
jgi:CheY-like chemotaxis protein